MLVANDNKKQKQYEFFKKSFDNAETLISESGQYDNINYSDIATKLIQDTGRFVERYASDFLISWDSFVKHLNTQPTEISLAIFGLRKDGVDHGEWVYETWTDKCITKAPYHYYRKIYALAIIPDTTREGYVQIVLKNILNNAV